MAGRSVVDYGAALGGSGGACPRAVPVSLVDRPYRDVFPAGPPPRGATSRGPRPLFRNGHGRRRISGRRAVPFRSSPGTGRRLRVDKPRRNFAPHRLPTLGALASTVSAFFNNHSSQTRRLWLPPDPTLLRHPRKSVYGTLRANQRGIPRAKPGNNRPLPHRLAAEGPGPAIASFARAGGARPASRACQDQRTRRSPNQASTSTHEYRTARSIRRNTGPVPSTRHRRTVPTFRRTSLASSCSVSTGL